MGNSAAWRFDLIARINVATIELQLQPFQPNLRTSILPQCKWQYFSNPENMTLHNRSIIITTIRSCATVGTAGLTIHQEWFFWMFLFQFQWQTSTIFCCRHFFSLGTCYAICQGWPNLLFVWSAYIKSQVTKSRNIKIKKHEFICNLRSCGIRLLERLAKVMLCSALVTTVPFYKISTLCNRNKKQKKQAYNFTERSKSRILRTFACGSRAAVWPPLPYAYHAVTHPARIWRYVGAEK